MQQKCFEPCKNIKIKIPLLNFIRTHTQFMFMFMYIDTKLIKYKNKYIEKYMLNILSQLVLEYYADILKKNLWT